LKLPSDGHVQKRGFGRKGQKKKRKRWCPEKVEWGGDVSRGD